MKKVKSSGNLYVFDTSALLTDSNSITFYKNSTVVLPISVISELDKHKTRLDEVGKAARDVHKFLNDIKDKGNIVHGVLHEDSGVTIRLMIENFDDIPPSLNKEVVDDRILSACFTLQRENPEKRDQVYFVTNDYNLSLKATAYGIKSLDYTDISGVKTSSYLGHKEVFATKALSVDKIYKDKVVECPKSLQLFENEYALIKDKANPKHAVRVRYSSGKLHLLSQDLHCYKIKPLNSEQAYLLDLLLNPEIKLITVSGKAGTGKSLISIAAGLEQTIGKIPRYNKLIISRSLEPLSGKDRIGFLKGSLDEKLAPYILPLKDAIDFALGDELGDKDAFWYLKNDPKQRLEIEPLQYIRGRSIPKAYMIVDEAQNLTKEQIKTILTRMGQDSKIILLGDLDQIDNYYVNKYTNGLAQTIERFKDLKLAGHIELTRGVRSDLANAAADLL